MFGIRSLAVAALTVAAVSAASGDIINLTIPLAGANERPNPVNSVATGSAQLTFDTATNQLTYNLTFSGLNNGAGGNATAGHIHIFTDLSTRVGPPSIFLDTNGVTSPMTGTVVLTAAQVQAIQEGRAYVNIHSTTFGSGEIRGDIPANSLPAPGALVALGLAGLAAGRRRR